MRSRPCLTSADVHKMMAACKAEAEKNKWNVCICIVDEGGFMLLLDRMDGAVATTAEVATGKARTAALTRRPSKFWEDRVKERPAFVNFPAGLLIQGGVPGDVPERMRRRDRRVGRAVVRGRADRARGRRGARLTYFPPRLRGRVREEA
jgi:glc operon protein GlcG